MDAVLLAPLALGLSVLVLGPVLIHLSRRQPRREIEFGAMMLLERVQRRLRRRRRVQDRAVLLLRALALGLIVLATARPEVREPGNAMGIAEDGPLVVVVDDSLSMDARVNVGEDETLFSRARAEAAAYLREAGTGVRVGAVAIGGTARTLVPELTADVAAVATAVEQTPQGYGATDLAGGIRLARRMLAGRAGRVVVFSDGSGSVAVPAAEEELRLLGQQGCSLERFNFRPEATGNIAPVAALYGEGVEGGSLRVRVVNHGESSVETPLFVDLPDGAQITAFVEVDAGAEQVETLTVPRVAAGGVATASTKDAFLEADNSHAFHLPRVGASRVMVVDGDPGPTPTASEVYFLERALAPWGSAGVARGGVLPEVTSPGGLDTLDPDVHRVVFLANVSDPAPIATVLTEFVRKGGGLVISVGSNVTAERYNGPLGGLLPSPLREPRSLAALGELGAATALPDPNVSLFAPFSRGGREGFARVHWTRLFTLAPYQDSEQVRTLLKTEKGMPILVERRVGKGRVLLLTGSMDLGWGDLPLQAVFMPLVQRIVADLGGESLGGGLRLSALVGDTVEVPLPRGISGVRVSGPAGAVAAQERDGGVRFLPARPGGYVVEVTGAPPLAWVAVNTDPVESDVSEGPSLVETAARVDPERYERKIPLGPWLLLAALVAVLASAGLAAARRAPSSDGERDEEGSSAA